MAKNLFIFNFKRWPKALLLSLVFIVCLEAVNFVFDDFTYPPPFDGLRMKIKNQIAQQKDNDYDVLVLGDCFNLHGANTPLIEQQTGMKVYNFSTHAAQTIFSSYLLLKKYLNSSAKKPKYIVVSYLPESSVLTKEQILAGDLSYFYDFIDGNIPELTSEFGVINTVKWLIPSLKHQEFLKKRFWGFQFPKEKEIKDFVRSVYDDRGYYRIAGHNYTGEAFYDDTPYRRPVSPFFNHCLRAIFDLAEQNNIQIIYTMYAAPPDWYAVYKRAGFFENYFGYFKSLQKDYPNIVYRNPEALLNKLEYFHDSTHLGQKGSLIYSIFLAKVLLEINSASIPRSF